METHRREVGEIKEADIQLVKIVSYPHNKKTHILGVSANLLGICFVLITGLRISDQHAETYADEICLGASFLFLSSCLLSYLSMRHENSKFDYERWADYGFMAGIISLFIAVCTITAGW